MKTTIIDEILVQLRRNPGMTRKELREAMPHVNPHTWNMYLCERYGYMENPGTPHVWSKYYQRKQSYFTYVDYKPAKGRVVHSFHLNGAGRKRADAYLMKFINS